jgi:hypothetical protein
LQLSESKKKSCREQSQKKERNLIIKERERTTEQLAGPNASPHSRRSEAAAVLPPPPAILRNALWIEPPLHAPTKRTKSQWWAKRAEAHLQIAARRRGGGGKEADRVTERILSDATAATASASSALTHSIQTQPASPQFVYSARPSPCRENHQERPEQGKRQG